MGGRLGEKGVGGCEGQRREERKRLEDIEKAPIRTVVAARCGIRAAEALITPALFSQPPPVRREREGFKTLSDKLLPPLPAEGGEAGRRGPG